ncbi:threonine synthase [Pyrofollis japonicus]|nr:threonine synthase [Pyrofollis japonicus]BEP18418.1 threonine synthase [Pyrofollis japonicus]
MLGYEKQVSKPPYSIAFSYADVKLRCIQCGRTYDPHPRLLLCPMCQGLLEVEVEPYEYPSWSKWALRSPGVWRYLELLPLPRGVEPVSLGEGWTPLTRITNIGDLHGVNVYAKNEGVNPTGSFKDRGMTVAVTVAKASGAHAVIVASTGNTASSAAAYAAKASMRAIIVVPRGKIALGKLAQSILYGAVIVEIEGSFDQALEAVLEAVRQDPRLYPLNSFNPWRLEGQKTIAFEIVEQLGGVPDWVVVPVGNAGNISAIWKGFLELKRYGLINKLPRMVGVQARGASPLASAWRRGLSEPVFFDHPETVATAIRIGRPINWPKAMRAVRESKGLFIDVDDDEILSAQRLLARHEGLAVEPASAASLAGLLKLRKDRIIEKGEKAVIVLTGHGLKDPDSMMAAGATRLIARNPGEAVRIVTSLLTR